MGLQQLVLAVSLMIAVKIVSLITPVPEVPGFGLFSGAAKTGKPARSNASTLSNPATDLENLPSRAPELARNNGVESVDPSFESAPPALGSEQNPVQDWTSEGTGIKNTRVARSRRTEENAATACQSVSPAVVTVHAGREIGSGSIVSGSGLVITNYHVISRLGDRSLFVKTQDGDQYGGQVIARDRRNDLALIQLQVQNSLPTVRLSQLNTPEVGQSVCAIGSPFGQAGKITAGNLIRILPNGDLQSDVELLPGNSGGPLINAQGEMIGVNKGVARRREEGDRVSYATSSAIASGLIEQGRAVSPTEPTSHSIPSRY